MFIMFKTNLSVVVCALTLCPGVFAQSAAGMAGSQFDSQTIQTTSNNNNQERIIQGNDQMTAAIKVPAPFKGDTNSFNFEEAPIVEVIHTILGDILKLDYVIHQPITGSVTLTTREPVTPDHAVYLLEGSLQANGLVMARDPRGVYHVGRPDALRGVVTVPRQAVEGVLAPGSGPVIIPLQYIGATEMATILRPMVPAEALVRVDPLRNILIMNGSRNQAEGWLDIVATFDVNLLKGMSVGIFPLKYATVAEVEASLRVVAGVAGAGGASPAAAPAAAQQRGGNARAPAGAAAAAAAAGVSLDGLPIWGAVRIMPIERINSILVVTPRAAYLEEARRWIEHLDQPSDNTAESQLFVYAVQNTSAAHLASLLSSIYGGETSGGGSGATGVSPGLGASSGSTSGFGGASTNSSSGTGLTSSSSKAQTSTSSTANMTASTTTIAGMRIVADPLKNSLLVYGPRAEYNKIEATLRRLDTPPTQVLIEASIIEVSLKDELEYGLQWFFDGKLGSSYNSSGSVGLPTSTATSGADATNAFTYVLKNAKGIRLALSALASKNLVKVISSPSLLVLDNHQANMTVGSQVSVKTGEISSSSTGGGTPSVSSSYQYKDIGVSLSVTPSVNAGNLVTMDINQVVSNIGASSSNGQPDFDQREITSKVAVRSGEAVVLGGLIRDNARTGRSGVPFLQDIPLVGLAFSGTSIINDRTELVVIITPRVIRSDMDAREISAELKSRMQGLDKIEGFKPKKEEAAHFVPAFNTIPLQ